MGHDLAALRAADIQLLQYFGIKLICDLMVEDKKRVYVLSNMFMVVYGSTLLCGRMSPCFC